MAYTGQIRKSESKGFKEKTANGWMSILTYPVIETSAVSSVWIITAKKIKNIGRGNEYGTHTGDERPVDGKFTEKETSTQFLKYFIKRSSAILPVLNKDADKCSTGPNERCILSGSLTSEIFYWSER